MSKLPFRIKICGITNQADALEAISCGADALGFIFAESPRIVTKEIVKEIINSLPSKIATVGVFVNQTAAEINEIMQYCGLKIVQLHGAVTPEFCAQIKFPFLKVFRIDKDFDSSTIKQFNNSLGFLLDTFAKEQAGGTGQIFDWSIAVQIKGQTKKPLILSGGLNPLNIAKAINTVQPDAVDISSGVEATPGKKDKQLLLKLFSEIKTTDFI